jgi:hypothetical protein
MSIAPALSVILFGLLVPQDDAPLPAGAQKVLDAGRAKLTDARAAYLAQMRAEIALLIAALKKEQEAATKAGDLDGALAIRERIERLQVGETLGHALVGPDDLVDPEVAPTKAAIVNFAWVGAEEDRVGAGRPIAADGRNDEGFSLAVALPPESRIISIRILADDRHGHWVTPEEAGRWPVAVMYKGGAVAESRADGLGRFAGRITLDLFIAPDADYRSTNQFEVRVTVRTARGRTEEVTATCKREKGPAAGARPSR